MSTTFTVINVTSPLAVVGRMVADDTVVFSPEESFVQTLNGVRHALTKKNGVSILKGWIASDQGFGRQERP